ncbi:MAG: glutathione S-transferase family protein [Sandaracinaceae bacterium]|nr:glutathione S-transferase family protein [Sandaracinaceae bacterium]
MGLLIDGQWHDAWYDTKATDGRFVRKESSFRHWVTPDGTPGPTGDGGFAAASGRYHLYVSHACPWAHRTLIVRRLKGLEPHVSVSVVNWLMQEHGWTFDDGPGVVPDPLHGARVLHQVYTHAKPDYTGRVTVPVLYDKERDTVVSNESSEIIRMFDGAFSGVVAEGPDLYPEALRDEIDRVNERVYHTVNNGVYRAGFATTQEAYEEAVRELFDSLDWLEGLLGERRYLAGDQLTEADVRLFTTLVRFDPVYVGHFKCNLRRIVDYPNLREFTRELYQLPGVRETVHMDHIKGHYYQSHETINPTGIVPLGPVLDLDVPHQRG